MRTPSRLLLNAALLLAVTAPVAVASPVPAPAQPARLGLCAACHGVSGHASMPGVPHLAGQRLDYLRDALKQYRDGRRNVPAMRTAIGPVNDAELDQLARWYSVQLPQSTP